jgi:hypothetical protein
VDRAHARDSLPTPTMFESDGKRLRVTATKRYARSRDDDSLESLAVLKLDE